MKLALPWSLFRYLDVIGFALGLLAISAQAWLFDRQMENSTSPVLTDFNDYHIVGRIVAAGRAAQAYDWTSLKAEQIAQTGSWAFMPWAYPPPFTLVTGVLGGLPLWAAYMAFIGLSWALFYAALCRLAGAWTVPAIVFALPSILINIKCGQNGFLTAGLIGWCVVGLRAGVSRAGWPLGLMIFKPHIVVGIGLLTLLDRAWGTIARAFLIAVIVCVVSTLVLGPSIWAAFREGSETSSAALWSGAFPLERMTSIFASLHRFGAAPAVAMACHVIVGLFAALWVFLSARHAPPRDTTLAAAVCVSLAISPYTYDYDLVSLSLIAALLLPRFYARATAGEVITALLLSWVATANYLWIGLRQVAHDVPSITAEMRLWTISPLPLAALVMLVVTVLRRSDRSSTAFAEHG